MSKARQVGVGTKRWLTGLQAKVTVVVVVVVVKERMERKSGWIE